MINGCTRRQNLRGEKVEEIYCAACFLCYGRKLTSLVIGHSAHPWCFKRNLYVPVAYASNRRHGWQVSSLKTDMISSTTLLKTDDRSILLVDNSTAHPDVVPSNVKIIFFCSNTTSTLQTVWCYHYRKKLLHDVINRVNQNRQKRSLFRMQFCSLKSAWDNIVKSAGIKRWFARCGFVDALVKVTTEDEPAQ